MSSSDSSVVDSPNNGDSAAIGNSSSPGANRQPTPSDQRAPLPPMAQLLRQRFTSPLDQGAVPPVSVYSSLASSYPIASSSTPLTSPHLPVSSLAFTPPSPILGGTSMAPSPFPSREVLQANMRSQRRTMSMSEELPHPLPIPQYPHQVWLAKQEGNLLIHRPLIMRETAQFFLSIKNWWSSSDYDRIADLVVNLFPELVEGGSEDGRDPMRRVRSDLSMYARNLRRRLNKRDQDSEARQSALMASDLTASSSPPALPSACPSRYSFKELVMAANLAVESLNSEANASQMDSSGDKSREGLTHDDHSPSNASSPGKPEATLSQGVVVKEEAPEPHDMEDEVEEEEEEEEEEDEGQHHMIPHHGSQPVFAVYPTLACDPKSPPGPLACGGPMPPHPSMGEDLSMKEPPPMALGMHCAGTLPYPLPVPPYSSSIMKARDTGQVAFHFQRIIRETTLFYLYFKYRWTSREFDRIAEVVMREFPEMGPQKRVKRALSSCARNWRKRLHSSDAQAMMKRAPKVAMPQAGLGLGYRPLPPHMELLPPGSLPAHLPMDVSVPATDPSSTAVSLVTSGKVEELESPNLPVSSESSTPAPPADGSASAAETSVITSTGMDTEAVQPQDAPIVSNKPRKKSGQRSLDTAWLPHNMKCNPTNSMLKSLPNPLPIPKYSFKILKAREMGTVKNCRSLIIRETARFFLYYKKWWSSSDYNRIAELIVRLFPELKNPVLAEGQVPYRRVKSDLSMCARNMRRKEMRNQRSLTNVGGEEYSGKYELQGEEGNSFDGSGQHDSSAMAGDSDLDHESMEVDENSQESDRANPRDTGVSQMLRPDTFGSLAHSAYMSSMGHSRIAQSMLAASHYQQQAAYYHQASKSPVAVDSNSFLRPGGKEVSAAEALALYRNRVRDLAVSDLQNLGRLANPEGAYSSEHGLPTPTAAAKDSGGHGRGDSKESSAAGKAAGRSDNGEYGRRHSSVSEREPGEVIPGSNHAGGRREAEIPTRRQHSGAAKTARVSEAGEGSAVSGESSEPSSPGSAKKMYVNTDHGTKLQRQITRFWKENKFMDAVLDVDGHKLPLHRIVLLAASPHLQSTLGEAELPQQLELSLPAGCTVEAARVFIGYLYEGILNLDSSTLPAMVNIANMLQIEQLARCCSDFQETYGSKSPATSSSACGSSGDRHSGVGRTTISNTAPPAHSGSRASALGSDSHTSSSSSVQRQHSVIQGHDSYGRSAPPRPLPGGSSRGKGEGEGASHGRQLVDQSGKMRLAATVSDILQQRMQGNKGSLENHPPSNATTSSASTSSDTKSQPKQRLASIESFRHRPSYDLPSSLGLTSSSHSVANGDADSGLRQGAVDMSRQKLASIACFQKRLSADDILPSSSLAASISQHRQGSLDSDYFQRSADLYSAVDASLPRTSSSTIPSQLASGGIAYGDPRYLAGSSQQYYSHSSMDTPKTRYLAQVAQYRLPTEDLLKFGLSHEDVAVVRQLELDSSLYRQFPDSATSQHSVVEDLYRLHQGDSAHLSSRDDGALHLPTSVSSHHTLPGSDLGQQLHLSEPDSSRVPLSLAEAHPHYSIAETLQAAALSSHSTAVSSSYMAAQDLSHGHGPSLDSSQHHSSLSASHALDPAVHSHVSLSLPAHAHLSPGETTHLHFSASKSSGHPLGAENGKLEESAVARAASLALGSPGSLSAPSQAPLIGDSRTERGSAQNGPQAQNAHQGAGGMAVQGRSFEDYPGLPVSTSSSATAPSVLPPPPSVESGSSSHHTAGGEAKGGEVNTSFHPEQASPALPAHPQPYAAMT